MIHWLRRNPVIGVLALLAVALAAVVALELAAQSRPKVPASMPRAVPAEAKLLPPVVAVAPEQAYPEIAARPLWIPTRRPAPQALAAAPSFARGQFILQGVTIAGNVRIAMLREKSSGKVHRVEKGRDVNGISVAEIEPEKVTLAQGGETEVLELRVQKPAGPATSAPGAVATFPTGPTAQGPFSSGPAAPAAAPAPGSQPPAQQPPQPAAGTTRGPMPTTSNTPAAPSGNVPAPAPQANAPMSPEELLARRRARRTQTPQ